MRRPCFGTMTPKRQNETGEGAKKTSTCFVLLRFSGKTLPGPRLGDAYLLPTVTTRRARPLFRRRERVARPPRVFILARNPCLLTRLRLRGLYVGFIPDSPIHGRSSFQVELGKIAVHREFRQRPGTSYCGKPPTTRGPRG